MTSKYTYGDIIHALKAIGVEPSQRNINDVSKLHFQYPNEDLSGLIFRRTELVKPKEEINYVIGTPGMGYYKHPQDAKEAIQNAAYNHFNKK